MKQEQTARRENLLRCPVRWGCLTMTRARGMKKKRWGRIIRQVKLGSKIKMLPEGVFFLNVKEIIKTQAKIKESHNRIELNPRAISLEKRIKSYFWWFKNEKGEAQMDRSRAEKDLYWEIQKSLSFEKHTV